MKSVKRSCAMLTSLVALGACTVSPDGGQQGVPEAVAALAAPGQDLQSARLMEEDGCYWYQHVGPVETTMLPLRARNGGRICAGEQA